MSEVLEEIRRAYATVGIRLDHPATYGTYYRLLCAGCGRMVGNIGDRLLPGLARELVDRQLALYASGRLGCACGHQREVARALDPARRDAAQREGERRSS
ncbi:MAG TPA: hypothetical protein VNN07_19070 [Candidatus Tectomicrobia bacterium]|nr:hypothetical protein [Candidatus Tectomicrobia bacterium]